MRISATNITNQIMSELIHKNLSFKLNGIFFEVQNKLGTKFQEKHYQKAICALLEKNNINFKTEAPIELEFDGKIIGKFKTDLIIDDKILIELKATDYLTSDHKQQLLRYLQALKLNLALLINFRQRPLQVWRVVN